MTTPSEPPQHRQFLDLATVDTWSDLQVVMAELGPAAPVWRLRYTEGSVLPRRGWEHDWDQQFRLTEYKYIEWCELRPRGRGLTLADIEGVCAALGFEIEVSVGSDAASETGSSGEAAPERVRVLGYRLLR